MNVTPEEILEVFEEAQGLGRRWRDPHLSIEGNLVLADNRACTVAPLPALIPVQPMRRGTWRVKLAPYAVPRKRPQNRQQTSVVIHVAPCRTSALPCPCGGSWEYREGANRPIHVPNITRGCKPPERIEFTT